jgi:hypothetical protein
MPCSIVLKLRHRTCVSLNLQAMQSVARRASPSTKRSSVHRSNSNCETEVYHYQARCGPNAVINGLFDTNSQLDNLIPQLPSFSDLCGSLVM